MLQLSKAGILRLAIEELWAKYARKDADIDNAIRSRRKGRDYGERWANQVSATLGDCEHSALEYLQREMVCNKAEAMRCAIRYTAYVLGAVDESIVGLAAVVQSTGGRFPPLLPEEGGPRSDV